MSSLSIPEQLAGDGYIVCFNVTEFRSDALIVGESVINFLPLSELFYNELAESVTWEGIFGLESYTL